MIFIEGSNDIVPRNADKVIGAKASPSSDLLQMVATRQQHAHNTYRHLSILITSRFAARPSANAWASPIFDASMSNMV